MKAMIYSVSFDKVKIKKNEYAFEKQMKLKKTLKDCVLTCRMYWINLNK